MSDTIHITDLAEPQLNELQESILAYGDSLEVDFDAGKILAEAVDEIGLDDFGPEDFQVRLLLLCDEWGADSGLNNLGKFSLRNKLLLYARNRLLIQDVLNRHPEIHDVKIAAPIIVAGLPPLRHHALTEPAGCRHSPACAAIMGVIRTDTQAGGNCPRRQQRPALPALCRGLVEYAADGSTTGGDAPHESGPHP